jgi:hypothetical protein
MAVELRPYPTTAGLEAFPVSLLIRFKRLQ